MTARYIVGDVFDVLATLDAGSVDLVLTSPPFWALRSYLPADHPDKPKEIGSESTPGEFIDTLLDVVEACERVLAPHGSMCIELGDTYSGSGGAGGDYTEGGLRDGQQKFRQVNGGEGCPEGKSLCLVPEIFRFSLVYGFNPLTGRQTPRWRARNVVRWARPNPPVGALGDKFRPATSEMVVICKSRTRYFDLDAVRSRNERSDETCNASDRRRSPVRGGERETNDVLVQNPAGAPPLDYWVIPTQPYDGSHYATYPEQLCVIPVKSMCPLKVCRVCGEPSRRMVESHLDEETSADYLAARAAARNGERLGMGSTGRQHLEQRRIRPTGEWTDCCHDDWRTGVVLDPFAGSGTTLAVATGHGRDAIGIDLDARNADLALDRVGPLILTVETLETAP